MESLSQAFLSFDIETDDDNIFAIGYYGCGIYHKNTDGGGGEYFVKTVLPRGRICAMTDVIEFTGTYWKGTLMREKRDLMLSEGVGEEESAKQLNLLLQRFYAEYPKGRVTSDFGSFDIGRLSRLLMKYGYPPMEMAGSSIRDKFRTDLVTSDLIKGMCFALDPSTVFTIREMNEYKVLGRLLGVDFSKGIDCKHDHLPDNDAKFELLRYANVVVHSLNKKKTDGICHPEVMRTRKRLRNLERKVNVLERGMRVIE